MEIPGAYNPCHVDLSSSSKDWTNGIYTTAVSGDQCRVGSFGVIQYKGVGLDQSTQDTFTCLTRIQDILLQGNHIQGLIVVEEFKVLEALHPTYLMPVTCPSGRRELAGKLVVSQVEKRAETNRKAAETRAKNAAAKNSGAGLTTADNREVQAPEGRKRKK
ncbi:hypothetical protein HHX47_DHR10000414 [Lentinula edodes]|nr:hypothetical protein HHX47_DHR10000414 [Lentinula edodes]